MTLQPNPFTDAFANALPACSRRRTILLAEDEPFVREATCNLLKHSGFEVLPAETRKRRCKSRKRAQRRIDLLMTRHDPSRAHRKSNSRKTCAGIRPRLWC